MGRSVTYDLYRQFTGYDSGKGVDPNEKLVALKYNDRVHSWKIRKNLD